MIDAGKLLDLFERMEREHWRYELGAAREGCVDCSGAFVWAYKQLGQQIEHGSNSIAHLRVGQYVDIKDAKPGYAVFKMRPWAESEAGNRWMSQSPGDVYHIGLMGRDGKVLNAQSSRTGFVASDAKGWSFAAPLKAVSYTRGDEKMFGNATVKTATPGSYVNLREGASTRAKAIGKVYDGTRVNVLRNATDEWIFGKLESGEAGYMAAEYIVEDAPGMENTADDAPDSSMDAEENSTNSNTTTLRRSDGVYVTLAGKWEIAED